MLSALAWWGTIRNATMMESGPMASMANPASLPFFLVMWTVMMIAMMFPSVAPMVIAYRRLAVKQKLPALATSIFTAGYIIVWAAIGLAAYLLYRGLQLVTPEVGTATNALVIGGLLAVGGAYQLSKLKAVCLTHCRGPLAFFFHFREGLAGGFRMGAEHGLYCVGCCWGLMLILFAFGLMSLAWMGAVAALIFVEKVTKIGPAVSRVAGIGMLVAAAAIALLGVL
ncbi:MAG: DUF2182 domain-containing protein [Acidimicrobiia bacterium]